VHSKASKAFANLCGNLAQFNNKRFGNDLEKFATKSRKRFDGGKKTTTETRENSSSEASSSSSSSSSSDDDDDDDDDDESSDDDVNDDERKISMFAKNANAKKKKANLHSNGHHQTEEELANIRRKEYKIKVKGDDSRNVIPAPLESFKDLETTYGCSKSLITRLEECKWLEPTPIQRQAIPMMLRDVETLAVAPTGSGKTLAFLLPIFMRLGKRKDGGVRAILLAPTKELATQSTRICTLLSDGLRCARFLSFLFRASFFISHSSFVVVEVKKN
jgi:ATP-dependent RNA helicase DDX52/ROK1